MSSPIRDPADAPRVATRIEQEPQTSGPGAYFGSFAVVEPEPAASAPAKSPSNSKPPNCFLLFRSRFTALAKEQTRRDSGSRGMPQPMLSKQAAELWHSISPEERAFWAAQADEQKRLFLLRQTAHTDKAERRIAKAKAKAKAPKAPRRSKKTLEEERLQLQAQQKQQTEAHERAQAEYQKKAAALPLPRPASTAVDIGPASSYSYPQNTNPHDWRKSSHSAHWEAFSASSPASIPSASDSSRGTPLFTPVDNAPPFFPAPSPAFAPANNMAPPSDIVERLQAQQKQQRETHERAQAEYQMKRAALAFPRPASTAVDIGPASSYSYFQNTNPHHWRHSSHSAPWEALSASSPASIPSASESSRGTPLFTPVENAPPLFPASSPAFAPANRMAPPSDIVAPQPGYPMGGLYDFPAFQPQYPDHAQGVAEGPMPMFPNAPGGEVQPPSFSSGGMEQMYGRPYPPTYLAPPQEYVGQLSPLGLYPGFAPPNSNTGGYDQPYPQVQNQMHVPLRTDPSYYHHQPPPTPAPFNLPYAYAGHAALPGSNTNTSAGITGLLQSPMAPFDWTVDGGVEFEADHGAGLGLCTDPALQGMPLEASAVDLLEDYLTFSSL